MKSVILILLFSVVSFSDVSRFPMGPSPQLTPGSFCTKPNEYRYREHIPVCHRGVDPRTKAEVFKKYNIVFNLKISLERPDFKIDHYIPLCMGGSNNINNLWPQHLSISAQTDDIEMLLCMALERNKISFAQAVETIKKVKNNLSQAPGVNSYLHQLVNSL